MNRTRHILSAALRAVRTMYSAGYCAALAERTLDKSERRTRDSASRADLDQSQTHGQIDASCALPNHGLELNLLTEAAKVCRRIRALEADLGPLLGDPLFPLCVGFERGPQLQAERRND